MEEIQTQEVPWDEAVAKGEICPDCKEFELYAFTLGYSPDDYYTQWQCICGYVEQE